jgi:hypothetical protein
MLKSRPTAEQLAENAKSKPQKAEKKGFLSSMMDRAEQQRQLRGGTTSKPGSKKPGNPKPPGPRGGTGGSGPNEPGSNPKGPGSGGNGRGGDPKKRPKR